MKGLEFAACIKLIMLCLPSCPKAHPNDDRSATHSHIDSTAALHPTPVLPARTSLACCSPCMLYSWFAVTFVPLCTKFCIDQP
jgi:hypothetical protein